MDFNYSEENRMFEESIGKWVRDTIPKDWAREMEAKEHDYPFELWDKFTEAGLHGIGIPEEYGGQGGDIITQMIVARELARPLGGLAWIWGITSFAGSKSIGVYGTEAQKQEFLPRIAAGELRAAIAFTEPDGGTDVLGALRTHGVETPEGWRLTGEKIWSSSAHVADYLLVLARTKKDVEKRHQGVSLFWVPAKQPGITITPLPKLGMRSMGSCTVKFEDVLVTPDQVLGEPHNAWYTLLPTLNNERLMVAAFCLGVMDGILEDALQYVQERKAFGKIIGQFQALQHYIADMATWRYSTELMMKHCAYLMTEGKPCYQESTMLKLQASEYCNRAADLGIQLLGGMGYSAETDMQRYWRDSRLWRIGPITNEMCRNAIAEGLGLPRSF